MGRSMTWGQLPSYEEFVAAFYEMCPPKGYGITLGPSDSRACDGLILGDGTWSASKLWLAIEEIVHHPDQERMEAENGPMDLVSAILGTLGFEWI